MIEDAPLGNVDPLEHRASSPGQRKNGTSMEEVSAQTEAITLKTIPKIKHSILFMNSCGS